MCTCVLKRLKPRAVLGEAALQFKYKDAGDFLRSNTIRVLST